MTSPRRTNRSQHSVLLEPKHLDIIDEQIEQGTGDSRSEVIRLALEHIANRDQTGDTK